MQCCVARVSPRARARQPSSALRVCSGRPLSPPVPGAVTPSYDPAGARLTVQFVVAWEIERKMTDKVGGKYTSASRSILRLLWFCDFLQVLLTHLTSGESPFKTLKEMASDAYDKALAPHHPYLVRKTIGAAMYFCPTEAAFWKRIVEETSPPRDEATVKLQLRQFLVAMAPVRDQLWAFFREHKLENLP